jgi:hypothetical protein
MVLGGSPPSERNQTVSPSSGYGPRPQFIFFFIEKVMKTASKLTLSIGSAISEADNFIQAFLRILVQLRTNNTATE